MGALFNGCPGAANIRGTPTLTEKICPHCGEIIEVFSADTQVPCVCGFVAFNDTLHCMRWCQYARACIGEEAYERLMNNQEV